MDLSIFWFVTLGVLMAGYAILDGFDLGVGILYLKVRDDNERRLFLNSIGPLWDGNEVWLVTFGGALFAAFPEVYATVFSGFYNAFMLLLFALIFRAVSMEFRSKHDSALWRKFWDISFFSASLTVTFLFGLAVGNCMAGLPIGADKEYQGVFTELFRPYPILVGLLVVATFAMHGAIYLYLKTEGALQQRIQRWIWPAFGFFMTLYIFVTIFTLVKFPMAIRNFEIHPWLWSIVVINVLSIANIPRSIFINKPFQAFLSSCLTIAALVSLFGAALFPNLVISSLNPDWSLTIYNACSSQKTLGIMRTMAFLGMPFVLTYTGIVYWVFRGKVSLGKFSY